MLQSGEPAAPRTLAPTPLAEPDAFTLAFRRAEPQLRRYLRHLDGTASSDDHEDLLSDATVVAWQRRHEFRGDGCATGWLLRICRTVCRASRRRRRIEVAVGTDIQITAPITQNVRDALRSAKLDDDRLSLILSRPTRQKHILLARYAEGMPINDIARRFGCAPGTVKATLHQATKWLKDHDPAADATNGA